MHWTSYIDRNKVIHQEVHDPAQETADPNAFWGSDSELHPPRKVGAKFNYLVDTEEGGGVEANLSGYSLEIKEKFASSLIQEVI